MQCLYTVFGYKHFLTTINYLRRLYTTLRQPYTILDGYILLSAAMYYFRRLYTTFSFTWLWFWKNPRLYCNFHICGLKARLEFNINLLAWIQFCFSFAVIRQKISFFCLNIVNEKLTKTLAKNILFSLQYGIENSIFMSSYRVRKFHIYARIRICGKMLLSYNFVWRKVQKIWYFRETETFEN